MPFVLEMRPIHYQAYAILTENKIIFCEKQTTVVMLQVFSYQPINYLQICF